MTVPTITYGHGFLEDCDDTSIYTEHEDGNTAILSVGVDDIFQITVAISVGNKSVYYEYPDSAGADDIDISSTLYPKALFRYKTSNASIKAKIELLFSDASTQTILDETSSTDWTVGSEDITTGKTIDHVRFYATQATGLVYYDFLMLHKETFTFPAVRPGGITIQIPFKTAKLEIPGREGDIIQRLGMNSPIIRIRGHMKHGETWGTTNFPYGEYLYKILRDDDPWQWLTTDLGNFPVTIDPAGCSFGQESDSGSQRTYTLNFVVTKLSSLGEITWDERQWYGK